MLFSSGLWAMQWYNLYYVFLPQLPQSGNSLTNLTRVLSLDWNLSDARPCYVDNINPHKKGGPPGIACC